jgi:hypothetical protein
VRVPRQPGAKASSAQAGSTSALAKEKRASGVIVMALGNTFI